ncbi:MAG: ABC-type transport auxiliary lipoprotein family protein [Gammaproteobacteria bacterium]
MRLVPGILVCLLVTGCAGSPPLPVDHFYHLPVAAPGSAGKGLIDGAIFVRQFIADGLYQERALIYTTGAADIELGQYHYHYWVDSPARLLRDQLIDYLRAADAAPRVLDAVDVPAQLRISARIKRFERRHDGNSDVVYVSLDFRVDLPDQDRPILLREYSEQAAVDGEQMEMVVMAFGKALSRIFAHLVGDIRVNLSG